MGKSYTERWNKLSTVVMWKWPNLLRPRNSYLITLIAHIWWCIAHASASFHLYLCIFDLHFLDIAVNYASRNSGGETKSKLFPLSENKTKSIRLWWVDMHQILQQMSTSFLISPIAVFAKLAQASSASRYYSRCMVGLHTCGLLLKLCISDVSMKYCLNGFIVL